MQVGDQFPIEEVGLSEGDGPAVVYFYAKAGTDGCTLEAHEFNRSYPQLREAGVRLVGVSVDPEDVNQRFAADCMLDFPLVSDPGGDLTRRLGLLKTYGEHGDFAARVTLLVDENGIVLERWEASVDDLPTHVDEVVERSTTQT
jgi:thioredoxin-dependent peroxiredoxin